MKKWFLCLILLSGSIAGLSQAGDFWQVLAQVSFQNTKDPQGYDIEKPVFSKYLKTFQGKKVKINGYIIPLNEVGEGGKFMLSALPFNVCYFCGAAGPETVVEIETDQKIKFITQRITMEGILFLNDKDPNHHIYVLKSASILK